MPALGQVLGTWRWSNGSPPEAPAPAGLVVGEQPEHGRPRCLPKVHAACDATHPRIEFWYPVPQPRSSSTLGPGVAMGHHWQDWVSQPAPVGGCGSGEHACAALDTLCLQFALRTNLTLNKAHLVQSLRMCY